MWIFPLSAFHEISGLQLLSRAPRQDWGVVRALIPGAFRRQTLLRPSGVSEAWHLLRPCVSLSLKFQPKLQVPVPFRIRKVFLSFIHWVTTVSGL